jgi:hypothetical protein
MPRHFYKIMTNPYFQSEHYKNSPAGQIEQKINKKINKFLRIFRFLKK